MNCEICEKEAVMYRKIDQNPRPLCKEHYDGVGGDSPMGKMLIQRHYFKI